MRIALLLLAWLFIRMDGPCALYYDPSTDSYYESCGEGVYFKVAEVDLQPLVITDDDEDM